MGLTGRVLGWDIRAYLVSYLMLVLVLGFVMHRLLSEIGTVLVAYLLYFRYLLYVLLDVLWLVYVHFFRWFA